MAPSNLGRFQSYLGFIIQNIYNQVSYNPWNTVNESTTPEYHHCSTRGTPVDKLSIMASLT